MKENLKKYPKLSFLDLNEHTNLKIFTKTKEHFTEYAIERPPSGSLINHGFTQDIRQFYINAHTVSIGYPIITKYSVMEFMDDDCN